MYMNGKEVLGRIGIFIFGTAETAFWKLVVLSVHLQSVGIFFSDEARDVTPSRPGLSRAT